MQEEELQQKIYKSLSELSKNPSLLNGTKNLLNILGYESEKTLNLEGVEGFMAYAKLLTPKQIKLIRVECTNIEFIFQITDEEIANQIDISPTCYSGFNKGNNQSFIFLAADMASNTYSRTNLANLTRILNLGVGGIPAIIIFRYRHKITLSIVHRRPSRRQGDDPDVLSRVTSVKDIDLDDPHRAHLEILSELSLHKAINQRDVKNFDDLHKKWEEVLNSETLSNRFYRDLFEWFNKAVSKCQFPKDETTNPQNHIIHLITRLLFIWFLKEKTLIPDEIFTEEYASKMVVDHQPNNSNYYHAVILNLFFSTLNTEIEKRKNESSPNHISPDKRIVSSTPYIYNALLRKPDDFAKSMEKIPFVNGGLFDRPASEVLAEDGSRFTEVSIPAQLLLDKNCGIFSLFRRYKFTVEENTPIEIEVALDPELMGMVFENLLAAYNPETSETVRKSTGSFYTPRPVVDYMVRQALTETLLKHVEPKSKEDSSWWRDRLEYLLDHSNAKADAEDFFDDEEKLSIINAISNLKTLDPAVGSGAFPMGILQTLLLALSRLDPENVYWKQIQQERSRKNKQLGKLSDHVGWERKLYLIQNTIYGVDKQTTACQIAKLRFFISLIIEQEPVSNQPNQGIQPLPNLENNLIAADTLLKDGLSSDQVLIKDTNAWDKWQKKIVETRQQYFLVHDQEEKKELIKTDSNLRKGLLEEVQNQRREQISVLQKRLEQDLDNIPNLDDREVYRSKQQIQIEKKIKCFDDLVNFATDFANWDPYDQNGYANWFSAKHMFGMPAGFDVVIGNPPYIQLQKNGGLLAKVYKGSSYKTFQATGDIYQLFYERGCELLNIKTGCLCYITSNSWLHAQYGKKLRQFFSNNLRPIRVIDMGPGVFDSATVDTAVVFIEYGHINSNSNHNNQYEQCQAMEIENKSILENSIKAEDWGILHRQGEKGWVILSSPTESEILKKIESKGTPLREFPDISIYYGIKTGYNPAFIVDQTKYEELIKADSNSSKILKPILRGSDIERYHANWDKLWLIDTHNG